MLLHLSKINYTLSPDLLYIRFIELFSLPGTLLPTPSSIASPDKILLSFQLSLPHHFFPENFLQPLPALDLTEYPPGYSHISIHSHFEAILILPF